MREGANCDERSVAGECIPEGASVTEGSAAQILLRMNLAVEDADSSLLAKA